MSIANVIAWKFDNQPGMQCKEIDGTLTIVEFPDGIPSQEDQDTWSTEYDAHIITETRRTEIVIRLNAIDTESVRALRGNAAGRGRSEDSTKLETLEVESETLRAELESL